jgi:hypothetical protein
MKNCNECGVSIVSGDYCKLCAPYMKELKMEVTVEDLDVFEIAELEALADEEADLYASVGNQWDMVEDHIRTHGTDVECDEEGHEIDVELVLNKSASNVYVPSELAEFESDQDAGSWCSPAALMVHSSECDSVMLPDYNDEYIELVHYYTNVFTRKNTITEDQALENLMSALAKLAAVVELKPLLALGKEIGSAQAATVYSKMYYFPKSCSKYFWSLYKAKKGEFYKQLEVDMKNYFDQLNACTSYSQMSLFIKQAYEELKLIPDCPAKREFWVLYKEKQMAFNVARADERKKVFVELCLLIEDYSSYGMLNKVRNEVFESYLPLSVKRVLWSKIQTKLQTGSVEINIMKGIEYMESEVAKAAEEKAKAYKAKAA